MDIFEISEKHGIGAAFVGVAILLSLAIFPKLAVQPRDKELKIHSGVIVLIVGLFIIGFIMMYSHDTTPIEPPEEPPKYDSSYNKITAIPLAIASCFYLRYQIDDTTLSFALKNIVMDNEPNITAEIEYLIDEFGYNEVFNDICFMIFIRKKSTDTMNIVNFCKRDFTTNCYKEYWFDSNNNHLYIRHSFKDEMTYAYIDSLDLLDRTKFELSIGANSKKDDTRLKPCVFGETVLYLNYREHTFSNKEFKYQKEKNYAVWRNLSDFRWLKESMLEQVDSQYEKIDYTEYFINARNVYN